MIISIIFIFVSHVNSLLVIWSLFKIRPTQEHFVYLKKTDDLKRANYVIKKSISWTWVPLYLFKCYIWNMTFKWCFVSSVFVINAAVCGFPSDPGPECVLPRHIAGDGPWHPVLLGCSYGDDGPQTNRQAALQRGETNGDTMVHDLSVISRTWPSNDDAFFPHRFICMQWWETPTGGRWANLWATSLTLWTSLQGSPWRWSPIMLWCMFR